jgi:ribonuclease I
VKRVITILLNRFSTKTAEDLEQEIEDPGLRRRLDTAGVESLTEDHWFRWLIKKYPQKAEKLDKIRGRLLEEVENQ